MVRFRVVAALTGLILMFLIYSAGGQVSSDSMMFQKREEGSLFRLTYGWKGFFSVGYRMDVVVLKSDLQSAGEEIGYRQKDLDDRLEEMLVPLRRKMIERLYSLAVESVRKSPFSSYITLEEKGHLEFTLRLTSPPELYAEVKSEFSRIMERIAKEQKLFFDQIEKKKWEWMRSYLEEKGLRLEGQSVSVDYGACVRRNASRMKDVTRTLRDLNTKKDLSGFVSVLLSFVQQISYGIPPLKEDGKDILGFWPPQKVLVTNQGDCDSKSVLFASCWTNFRRYPLLLIKVPQHMFIGLAIPSMSDSGVVINGLRYTLCEVAGPDRILPGLISSHSRMYLESGRYRYELIR